MTTTDDKAKAALLRHAASQLDSSETGGELLQWAQELDPPAIPDGTIAWIHAQNDSRDYLAIKVKGGWSDNRYSEPLQSSPRVMWDDSYDKVEGVSVIKYPDGYDNT